MKTKILFYLFILFSYFTTPLLSQKTEQKFVPYYIKNNKVESFERIGAKIEAKSIGYGGYGGINQYLTVFNSKHSDVRFKKNELPKFIIEVDEHTDIFELVIISKADPVKKKKTYRRFIQKGSSYGGGAKDLSKYLTIPDIKKIKNNLYEITFSQPLEQGEYSFLPIYKGLQAGNIISTTGNQRIYCFGID